MTRPRLGSFLLLSLVLGIVGFGGGYAVAQRVRLLLVDERRWLTEDEFVDAFAVASSLPGTTSANLLTVVGHRFGGVVGALAATSAFVAPSVLLMIVFGSVYEHLRSLSALASFLDGMGAATVGVIAAVAVQMRATTVRSGLTWGIAVAACLVLSLRFMNLLEVIALAAFVGALAMRPHLTPVHDARGPASLRAVPLLALGAGLPASLVLLGVFARIGVATFGGGVAMIAPMQHEVVNVHAWLDEATFSDAIVLGQITPGPVAIAATFIGYRVSGLLGALLATVGIFGPPFVLSLFAARSIPAFRANPTVRGALAGIAPAVVGVVAAAAVALGRGSLHGWTDAAVAALALLVLLVRPKLAPVIPILGGGAGVAALRLLSR